MARGDQRSEERDGKNTSRCMEVADAAFRLFGEHQLGAGDGLFTSIYMVARHIQRFDPIEREPLIHAVAQLINDSVFDIDKTIYQKQYAKV